MLQRDSAKRTTFDRRVRSIRADDAPLVAEFILQIAPVSDTFRQSLPGLLRRLISEEILGGIAVDYVHDTGVKAESAAFGISGFVHEAWAATYLASPSPHMSLTLLHDALNDRGAPPFLTLKDVAQANAGHGLILVPLFWLQRSYDRADPEAHALLSIAQQSLLRGHEGYLLSRVIKEVPAILSSAFAGGGFKELARFPAGTPLGFSPGASLAQDHIVYTVARSDFEGDWPGKAVGRLFAYTPPRCGFTYAEQQILLRAMNGVTDARIARDLGISLAAVNLRWRSIYGRVADYAPSVLLSEDSSNGSRGTEKRRLVISFVADHPEELRPYGGNGRRQGSTARL
ncbi:hypothetical protein Rvan_2333 [Rhodomicrobium vannielii ATCC 17100]|uniref:Uncharacterized protein n=1 Tax=Rhodomicrobium vannielii (strain ATCC 17100 / DSM 162 / LMG 4299 / NCIMB 10020 / ATH 3.1.1) TaxID=648757 RepID=E3I3Z4_RHOVT|nr:hypothetical protein [Rhodomicrobium vannielii]ADP71557.1 hypothetical protein Rvan_2333 [Rhodomicrobium vannielii ATCC 17100]